MTMRDQLAEALKSAMKTHDKRRVCTLRLIQAAVHDRDIANRGAGKDPVSEDDILQILAKMIKQREESAKAFEDGSRIELAEQERAEIEIIRDFMPKQLCEDDTRAAVAGVIEELNAEGLRDMGRCMAALKERFAGQMDFAKASAVIKGQLQ